MGDKHNMYVVRETHTRNGKVRRKAIKSFDNIYDAKKFIWLYEGEYAAKNKYLDIVQL